MRCHVVATDRLVRLPLPRPVPFRAASVNELTALGQSADGLNWVALVVDKANASTPFNQHVVAPQQVSRLTPIQKATGQTRLASAAGLYSSYVSRMGPPIERLLKWFIGRVGLPDGGRVRSEKGAMLPGLGRLVAWFRPFGGSALHHRLLLLIHIITLTERPACSGDP